MKYLTRGNATLAYLVAVLLLGGASADGFRPNLLLQIIGAFLIAWTLWQRPLTAAVRTGLGRFGVAFVVLAAVQFLVMPPAFWQMLPGRGPVYEGFQLLGVKAPWFTMSLAPWRSLDSLVWWIPALAVFLSMRADGAPPARNVIMAITAVAAVSVFLGSLQRGLGTGYTYTITNYGQGPGFFANSNHQGSFLLVALALLGAHIALRLRERRAFKYWQDPALGIQIAVAAWLAFGVLVSGSLACVLLLIPVAVGLFLIMRPDIRLPLGGVIAGGVLLVAALATFLLMGPVANDLTAHGVTPGISRLEFLQNGLRMLGDFAPFGSGLGTFQELYRWYEDPALVGTTFVNHAHNDLLELLVETGIFGLAALVLFLVWFLRHAVATWREQRGHAIALGASVAIGVMLTHSLVDYPLRTAAMSTLMGLCCVLLVRAPEAARSRGRQHQPDHERAPHQMVRI